MADKIRRRRRGIKTDEMCFASIAEAIEDFRAGKVLIIIDDEDRENEGDLTVAAEKITPEIINFMATYGRGLICLALIRGDLRSARSSADVAHKHGALRDGILRSGGCGEGITTGISAFDRAKTIEVAMRPESRPHDLARPGHVFPLKAKAGGVLMRTGQTEAAVDLARLAGLRPGGVICEIMNADGTMARVPQLIDFCRKHKLKMISVAEMIRYRMQTEQFVKRDGEGSIRTRFGEFKTVRYTNQIDNECHLVLTRGDISGKEDVLVRVHSHCVYGDAFGSLDCDCHELIPAALERISEVGTGVFLYLHQTGPGLQAVWQEGEHRLVSHGASRTDSCRQKAIRRSSTKAVLARRFCPTSG